MNTPNVISLCRLMCAPLTVWLVLEERFAIAFWIFVAAGASDAVDGFIARRWNLRTTLGSYLDPLADKALLVSAFVALGAVHRVPPWLVILVVFRDLLIVGGKLLMLVIAPSRAPVRPLLVSKVNTAAQIALTVAVLAASGLGMNDEGLMGAAFALVGITTTISGAAYVGEWLRRLDRLAGDSP